MPTKIDVRITDVKTLTAPFDGKRTFVITYAGGGIRGTMKFAESTLPEPLKQDRYGVWYSGSTRVRGVFSAYPHSIDSEDAARAAALIAIRGARHTWPVPPRVDAVGKVLNGNAERLVRPLLDKPCPRSLTGWHGLRYRKLVCHEDDGGDHEYRRKGGCRGFHYGLICGCGFRESD